MEPPDAFGIVVRTVGLILTLIAVWLIGAAILNLVGGGPGNVVGLLISGVPALFIGLWFLGGAKDLVRFVFRDER
jgi:hypothetical protein